MLPTKATTSRSGAGRNEQQQQQQQRSQLDTSSSSSDGSLPANEQQQQQQLVASLSQLTTSDGSLPANDHQQLVTSLSQLTALDGSLPENEQQQRSQLDTSSSDGSLRAVQLTVDEAEPTTVDGIVARLYERQGCTLPIRLVDEQDYSKSVLLFITDDCFKASHRVQIFEGDRLKAWNLTSRKDELVASAQSRYEVVIESICRSYPPRRCSPLSELRADGFKPPFEEFDTVGVVVMAATKPHGLEGFKALVLACPPLPSDVEPGVASYLTILCVESRSVPVPAKGTLLACANIWWMNQRPWHDHPVAGFRQNSFVTDDPYRYLHLMGAMADLRSSRVDFAAFADQCIPDAEINLRKTARSAHTQENF